jgi:hypothetical protein
MADETPITEVAPNQGATGEAGPAAAGGAPASAPTKTDAFADRPELFVGGAFVGGFVLAKILKRFGP